MNSRYTDALLNEFDFFFISCKKKLVKETPFGNNLSLQLNWIFIHYEHHYYIPKSSDRIKLILIYTIYI